MLVRTLLRRLRRRDAQRGFVLIIVLGTILLVSSIGALVVTSSSFAAEYTTKAASQVQARAAADAGIDSITALFASGQFPACDYEFTNDTDPKFSVRVLNYRDGSDALIPCTSPLPSGTVPRVVEVASRGFGPGTALGDDTGVVIEVLSEIVTTPSGGGAAFFAGSNGSINNIVLPELDGVAGDVIVQDGSLTCHSSSDISGSVKANQNLIFNNQCTIRGDVYVNGYFSANSNVTVMGDLIVAGVNAQGVSVNATNPPVTVGGNIIAAGHVVNGGPTGSAQMTVGGDIIAGGNVNMIHSTVGGDIWAGGDVRFQNTKVSGNVLAVGNLMRFTNDAKIDGSLRVGGNLSVDGGVGCSPSTTNDQKATCLVSKNKVGGPVQHTQIGIPSPNPVPKVKLPKWIDIPYVPQDWIDMGFQIKGTETVGCGFANWDNAAYNNFINLTVPTVLDLRSCGSVYSSKAFQLKTDIVLLVSSWQSGGGTSFDTHPSIPQGTKLWFYVPDNNVNNAPTCSGGAGNLTFEGRVGPRIQSLAYTPCTLSVNSGFDFRGQLYGGNLQVNGTNNVLTFVPTGVPGVDLGGGDEGSLESLSIRSRLDVAR